MNRQAQAVVLFLVGVAVLRAGFTDLYLRYVKAGLQPLLLLAGAVLIVAAAATLWYDRRPPHTADGGEAEHDEGHEHGHAHREPRVSWLLVLPLVALILVAPPALGSYSAMRAGTALQQTPWGYPKLPAGDPLRLNLADYAGRAAYDHGRSLGHRHVKVAGFVALDKNGTAYLVRMALNCCAADAQPVKVGLSGNLPPVLQPDTWLEVTGTYTGKRIKDPVNDGVIPFLEVEKAKPVKAPRDPYDESWNG
ncbi:TIGR03943 family putative permease subunit [Streptomyces spongiae]|uniref:TIGR03943 family protein n=1 Tax=Streptomyces spongiae TaxID=565072 RepID=A0A5N8XHE7_9ACTN|nr:TIGR03943 family protein [Streptomyces spongiae]MPY58654.1 TIGR03943 family protein [Streptomyces spongiae]